MSDYKHLFLKGIKLRLKSFMLFQNYVLVFNAFKRHHDQGISYKIKHIIGVFLTVSKFQPIFSLWLGNMVSCMVLEQYLVDISWSIDQEFHSKHSNICWAYGAMLNQTNTVYIQIFMHALCFTEYYHWIRSV